MENEICKICGKKIPINQLRKIHLSADRESIISPSVIPLHDTCLQDNLFSSIQYFVNFLKIGNELYVDRGTGTFELVKSQVQIDEIFSPEKARFEKWYNKMFQNY